MSEKKITIKKPVAKPGRETASGIVIKAYGSDLRQGFANLAAKPDPSKETKK
ncbi:hypothetical protein [Pararhizobium qamdonense]|uniref:hypothetical protein n=1 Tax=Pararhizobium qamdonense TaxID=3031126 RepID=UPI0023E32F59|nr:hypothetical protein [Pararhizobium qamdonense]